MTTELKFVPTTIDGIRNESLVISSDDEALTFIEVYLGDTINEYTIEHEDLEWLVDSLSDYPEDANCTEMSKIITDKDVKLVAYKDQDGDYLVVLLTEPKTENRIYESEGSRTITKVMDNLRYNLED